jgi:hypothetical protein
MTYKNSKLRAIKNFHTSVHPGEVTNFLLGARLGAVILLDSGLPAQAGSGAGMTEDSLHTSRKLRYNDF